MLRRPSIVQFILASSGNKIQILSSTVEIIKLLSSLIAAIPDHFKENLFVTCIKHNKEVLCKRLLQQELKIVQILDSIRFPMGQIGMYPKEEGVVTRDENLLR